MYCTQCGAPNPEGAAFCADCGAPLSAQNSAENDAAGTAKAEDKADAQSAGQAAQGAADENRQAGPQAAQGANRAGGLSPEEIELIGPNAEYYAYKFSALRMGGGMISWNWCAALFFPYWAIYRKMYKEAIGFIVLSEALSWIMGGMYPGIVISILLGMFGNWFYLRSVSSHAVAVTAMPEGEKQAYIAKFGGVSSKNVWLLVLALVVLNWITLGIWGW